MVAKLLTCKFLEIFKEIVTNIMLILESLEQKHEKFRITRVIIIIIILARTPEIGQGLGRILSYGASKSDLDKPMIIMDSEPPPFFMTY